MPPDRPRVMAWLCDVQRTARRLELYDGRDDGRPLYLALCGRVLDVTAGRDFYGPEGAYRGFAGRGCSRAFALMSLAKDDAHDDLTGLTDEQLDVLDEWCDKLFAKYPAVGRLPMPALHTVRPSPATPAAANGGIGGRVPSDGRADESTVAEAPSIPHVPEMMRVGQLGGEHGGEDEGVGMWDWRTVTR